MAGETARAGDLGRQIVARMNDLTLYRHGEMALRNAARNKAHLAQGQSLAALRNAQIGKGDSAIVVAAGPSIKRQDPLRQIKGQNYRGALVVTESALRYCLRSGVIPDLAVTVDPDPTRVVRWLGDPSLSVEKLQGDDYFARQEQDDSFADQMRANDEVLELLNRHGKDIRLAISTSSSEAVVKRAQQAGMQLYWWNPMLDDPEQDRSITARLQSENDLPCVNAGGNVGSACWMMATAVLGKRRVALTGIDFSYYDETPYRNTQYYPEIVALVGAANLESVYMRVYNPHLKAWFFTDPAYMWYRECFLQMVADAECETINCTEGGIVFGEHVRFAPLSEFLAAEVAA